MAINGGKITGKKDGTFDALQSRLAAGKGKASPISTASRKNKTSWSKTMNGKWSKGNPTFAVGGQTPGTVKPGPGPSSKRGTF